MPPELRTRTAPSAVIVEAPLNHPSPILLFGVSIRLMVHDQDHSERSRMNLERFCEGCGKQHASAVWYYRNRIESTVHEWLCSVQYLRLPPQTMCSWRTFLYLNR